MIHQSGVQSTMMPRHPWTAACHPIRHFPALLGVQHIGGIGQGLRDAFARSLRKHDLLGAQALADAADVLNPEQRRKVADWMARRGPWMPWHRG